MSVRDEITRLETAKSDIETAIETCGVNVPDTEKISAYASYIRQIPSAIFSELNVAQVGGADAYIKTIKQTNGVIKATTGGLVSSSSSGLTPKIGTASSATISKQADEWVLTSTKGATPTWRKLPVNAFKNDNDNTTYTLSGALDGNAFVSTLTPSSGSPTTATVPAMTGASSNAAGKAGLVPAPAKNNEGKFLRGDGTWAIPSKSENSYYLYTQYQNSTDFYPNYKAYLKWIANDVAAFHFTDGTYKFKADLADSVPWTGVTGRPTALSEFTDDILANHYLPLSGGQLTGNLTLYAGSGNSPYIRFQRGSNKADTLCDWTIVDEGGYLIFREGVNGAEEDVLKICGSANTSAFTGSVSAASFVGSLTGNADTATYATYLGTSSDNYSKATLDAALGDKYSSSVARTKNTVLAAPNGQNGNATFRALVAADLPSHNHSSAQITSLTSYTKATKNGSLATTDTLNSALGKLEYKADLGKSAYDIISAAYDGDGVIENLTEILKVLEGISDTDTITSIIGKYLPLTGGSLSSEAYISWTDRGAWGNSSAVYPYSYGGLSWSGTSDWIKLYGKEESSDKLNLIIEFGDDSGHDIKLIDHGTERIVMHSGNYTSYTVEKDGTGATGTWGIDISGNAATATTAESTTKLARAGYLESDSAIDNFLEANTFKYALFKTTSANKVAMASNDGMLLSIPWSSTTYGFQLAFDDTTDCVMKGRGKATNWGSWHTFIHSGNYTSYVNETNFPGIKKTGTVTKVSTGTGLTGGDITSTGTIKCNLNSETSLGTLGSTSKLYAVGVDANGKLCVKVPWEKGLASESDPVFSASAAAGITAADIANWNSKTSNTGDITGVTAGDGLTGGATSGTATLNVGAGTGISVAADAVSISSAYQTKISNGATAYGWGNHASAKYMKAVGRHSGSMDLNKVDSTMSVVTEIRPSEITTTNLPSDYGTDYGCMISARDGNSNYGHGKMQILGCNKKFWMRATQGADEANDGTWCRLALTSDIPSVGNGTVTINQAGASKGSFTLNQSTAATINLSDTNYYPTAFSWTGGTTAGPTGSLTGVGMSAVSFGAIPAASGTASGIVTTGDQSFSGQKTFETVVFANYIFPISNTTGCGIGTSAWRYYEGYFKNLYTTYIYMYPRTYSGTLYLTGFKDAPSSTSTVNSQLYASSYVKVQNSASSSAAVYAPGGFYESSDERLKNLLKPVRVDLDELSKLRKVYYTWKNSSDLGIHLGIVAQDVQKLYPELVTVDSETGYLSLSYDKLSVIALGAIDKLYEMFKKLSFENESLKNRLENLEKLI